MNNQLYLLMWLAVATASISFTITKTQTFNFIRDRLPDNVLYELMTCPYCMSHYVAAFFVLIYKPMPFSASAIDMIPSMFIIVTLAAFLVQGILLIARILNVLSNWDKTAK